MKKFNGFMHGVNLGGWYSQCNHTEERYDNFIKEEDFKTIAEWGLDHIRLPIDYELVETAEGQKLEKGYERIRKAADWCKKYNLNMILDLHKTCGYSFDIGYKESGFFERAGGDFVGKPGRRKAVPRMRIQGPPASRQKEFLYSDRGGAERGEAGFGGFGESPRRRIRQVCSVEFRL